MYLIFDTETTGLPRDYNAPLTDSDNWPRMVQIAWQLHDEKGHFIKSGNHIVKPDGFTIPFNAAKVHGITTEMAHALGIPLQNAMDEFLTDLQNATILGGHNLGFDLNIIGAEFHRLGLPDFFEGKQIFDTMESSTDYCAIPGGRGGKFKFPKLEELHYKLFNTGFSEAHNACADVEATGRCFFELLRIGVLKYADSKIENDIQEHLKEAAVTILSTIQRFELADSTATQSSGKKIKREDIDVSKIKFTHLHNHSQFSVLQSTTDIDDLVKKAVEYKSTGIALTDHGNMYGAFRFWQSIDKQNKNIKAHNESIDKGEKEGDKKEYLKAIIGCELNVTVDRTDKKSQNNGYTQVFLAKNQTGYQNLCKLSSIGFIEGFYYVPRIDKNILVQHKEGLIVTTGSLTSEIPSLILNVGETQAEQAFCWWLEQFGEDFYVELNRHKLEDEDYVNRVLLEFAQKYNVKYFAANSNYYLDRNNAKAHDVLLCIKDGELVETQIGRGRGFRYGLPNDEYYFKSTAEMVEAFIDLPEALEETEAIVAKIENFKLGRDVLLPTFQIPENFTDQNDYLRHLTYEGAKKRYPELTESITERLDFELATIAKMGFPGYFLIVQDFTTYARDNGVSVGPGRGSAAGSAIAYCLGITNVDPIKYDLLFERFLNPDRVSMPDIDIDFDDEGRDKVIKYVVNKYGALQVAQIITYGTLGGRSALRDASRALNLPLADADRLAKAFPDAPEAELKLIVNTEGINAKLKDKLREKPDQLQKAEEFYNISQSTSPESLVIKQARELEGCVRNTGIHACGIIITPDELTKFVPVAKAKEGDMLVTQFDNSVAETAGLLKMDFLGLRTLTIIKDTLRLIKKTKGIDIDIDAIPLDDAKTFELFQRGLTKGIFQFESVGMQKYLKELKPNRFDELIAMNALYRPGPLAYIPNFIKRKHGQEEITYDVPAMEEYLKDTNGITVYQEQVMLLSQKLANFTKGDADTLRKAMGKKQKDVLDKMKSKFIAGAEQNGHPADKLEKIWTDWEAFASYAFNKSHSTCYAYIAYQTAYLKANYTPEFLAANLTHNMSNTESVAFYMEECKSLGVEVLGPDINESEYKFAVNSKGNIRVGLGALKGVGENAVQSIVEEREANGFFKSIFDVTRRINLRTANKRVFENLAYAGGFDSFPNIHRAQYFASDPNETQTLIEKSLKYGQAYQAGENSAQASLFGEGSGVELPEPAMPKCEAWSDMEKLRHEKDMIGIYISGHPLDTFRVEINNFTNYSIQEIKLIMDAINKKVTRDDFDNYIKTPRVDFRTLMNLRDRDISPQEIDDFYSDKTKSLQVFPTCLGREFNFGGMVVSAQHKIAKTGNPFGTLIIEDYEASYEFVLFGEDYLKFKPFLVSGLFLFVRGKIDIRFRGGQDLAFKIHHMQLLQEIRGSMTKSFTLQIPVDILTDDKIDKLLDILNRNKGEVNFTIELYEENERVAFDMFSKKFRINPSNEFIADLAAAGFTMYEINKTPDKAALRKIEKLQQLEKSLQSDEIIAEISLGDV